MNESPGALELLSSRVDELEKRIYALEHPSQARSDAMVERDARASSDAGKSALAMETGSIFPVIGRAMLGIAGAYVLRAIAEAGVFSRLPTSAFAVVYAFGWLLWSTRVSGRLPRTAYAGTSALILAPLLWENTLTFHVFAPVGSAGVLASFLVLAMVLEVRDDAKRQSMWIAQSIAVITAAALALATNHILPFIITLLIAVVVSEFARTLKFEQPLWPLMVLVADAVIWAQIYIYAGPQNARAAYPELSMAALIAPTWLLFAINGTGVLLRTVWGQTRISALETIQVIIAFLLAAAGVLYFAPATGIMVLGAFCLLLSGGLYVVSFRYLRDGDDRRNLRVFSAWSAAVLLVGSLWALPRSSAATLLAISAVVAVYIAQRMEPGILELHGAAFLLSAMVIAGFPRYVSDALAGSLPSYPAPAIWAFSACAVVASLLTRRTAESTWQRVLQFVPSLLAVCALIASLVHGVLAGISLFLVLGAHHLAFLRTLTICLAALALAFGGSRWQRAELTRLAYFVLVFVAAKLLFEDLRQGHMVFIAASIALFAIALIAAPRLARLGATTREGDEAITAEHVGLPPWP